MKLQIVQSPDTVFAFPIRAAMDLSCKPDLTLTVNRAGMVVRCRTFSANGQNYRDTLGGLQGLTARDILSRAPQGLDIEWLCL